MPRCGTLQVATPTDTTIVMTRTFDAPRRLVWDAMTKGGIASMKLTLAFGSKGARDAALKSGMEQGMEAGYQQLDAFLAAATTGA